MNDLPEPFIGVRMHKNKTATGRRSSMSAKKAAIYFAFGRDKQAQQDGQQRGEWWGENGRVHTHEDVMTWAKQEALKHRYTFQAILSVPHAELNPEQFCQAMAQSDDIQQWRLIVHDDTNHCHAHVLFFRNKRLGKRSFLRWQTAVRQELSRLEQQSLQPQTPESEEEQQIEITLPAKPSPVSWQEAGLTW